MVAEAKNCALKLRSTVEAKNSVCVVRKYDRRVYGRRKWVTWVRLIDLHQTCLNQIKRLEEALLLFSDLRASKTIEKSDRERFLQIFSKALLAPGDTAYKVEDSAECIGNLEDEIKRTRLRWEKTAEEIPARTPEMFLTHAFFVAARATGVEVVSLFVGGLISLGVLFTWAFYFGAVNTSILRYVTLEDFVDEGIRSLMIAGACLAVAETGCWLGWKRGPGSRGGSVLAPHRLIVRHPARTAGLLFCAVAVVVGLGGFCYGKCKQGKFFDLGREELEVATALDGTVLRDVYLVGTTARTASFLQACGWRQRGEKKVGLSPGCERGGVVEGGVARAARVVVMDRALLVCHAKGEACLDQGRPRWRVLSRR